MSHQDASTGPFNVLIVGGGVAALEAALALRQFGGKRIATTLLAPNPDFVYRPMTVVEPFGFAAAKRYPLEQIARDLGAELRQDSCSVVDSANQAVHTEAGERLTYDALLLALGARIERRYEHAITVDDAHLDELMHGLIQDVEAGYVHKLAFVIPPGGAWPLPLYELALMTAARAEDMNISMSITIVTPEDAPLVLFGTAISDSVRRLLEEKGILTITSAHPEVHKGGRIALHPGERELHVDRIVALPRLVGPSVSGVPHDHSGGFIPVDGHGKVATLDRVYAAGDATHFPVKHGGVAAQQADVAAQSIAALAGLAADPEPFRPELYGVLLTGAKRLYLHAHLTGGHGSTSELTDAPTWQPTAKIAAKYLGPYLENFDRATGAVH